MPKQETLATSKKMDAEQIIEEHELRVLQAKGELKIRQNPLIEMQQLKVDSPTPAGPIENMNPLTGMKSIRNIAGFWDADDGAESVLRTARPSGIHSAPPAAPAALISPAATAAL